MGKHINEAVKNKLASIYKIEQALVALEFGYGSIRFAVRSSNPDYGRAMDTLRGALHEELVREYQLLFAWGVVDQEARREARRIAFERVLSESRSTAEIMGLRGEWPGVWTEKDERDFRREIEEARKAAEKEEAES